MPRSIALTLSWLSRRRPLLALALLYTLLNAPKPLIVDDTAYYYFARQFAEQPTRPYDFSVFWYQRPEPANSVLAPPVLPCWWSLGLRLFGETPWLWKLWLLPFALLFVFSLDALARRFAPGMRHALVWLTVLSPSFLPSFNLMLDVPAVALGLTALVLCFRAIGRRSFVAGALAGVIAGLAMQTKYTSFMVPAVMLLYTVCFARTARRLAVGLLAVTLAVLLFVSWESLIYGQQGESHFRANLPRLDWEKWWELRLRLLKALLPMLGGLAPALTLLGMLAVGVPRWAVGIVAAWTVLGYGVIARYQVPPVRWENDFWLESPLEQTIFLISGVFLLAVVALVCWDLLWEEDTGEPGRRRRLPSRVISSFLVLWLFGELAGYFLLSTFPAARRVMGLVLIATFLICRLGGRSGLARSEQRWVKGVVGGGVAVGFLFYAVDLLDAFTGKHAAEAAARWIAEQPVEPGIPPPTVWYVGHWGFQYYAERAGMQPVVPDRSWLKPGDWLIVPHAPPPNHIEKQAIRLDDRWLRQESVVRLAGGLPWRTVMCYYGGYVPLEHHAGPRLEVTIYRVTGDWLPRTPRNDDGWSQEGKSNCNGNAGWKGLADWSGEEFTPARKSLLLLRVMLPTNEEDRVFRKAIAGLPAR